MENKPKNKSAFNALYYGQKVFCSDHRNLKNVHKITNPVVQFGFLVLKPTSQITDEDAIEVARICLDPKEKPLEVLDILDWGWCKRIVTNREPDPNNPNIIVEMFIQININDFDIKFTWDYNHAKGTNVREMHCPNSLLAYDYLRSKGYALPFLNLSVEDLQTYGWIKLSES